MFLHVWFNDGDSCDYWWHGPESPLGHRIAGHEVIGYRLYA
jgi:hypothetical protein